MRSFRLRFRVRPTVGWLMIAVLAAGLVTWRWVIPWVREPSTAERAAQARLAQAVLTREVAEYAVKEYEQGVYKQDLETVTGEVALAQADLTRAADRLRATGQLDTDDERLHAALELAAREQERRAVLRNFAVQSNSLKADVGKARAAEAQARAAYQAERAKRWRIPGLGAKVGD